MKTLTQTEVRFALRRTGFEPRADEVRRFVGRSREELATHLLEQECGEEYEALLRSAPMVRALNDARSLQAWWLLRMVRTRRPLDERLCLHWHDHFATSNAKVRHLGLMLDQNLTFLEKGRGTFRALLEALTHDPAMLIWLDSDRNVKGRPNENLAREIMELFSLGEGHYGERDIREAARALTGLRVHADRTRFDRSQHDGGEKELFSARGRFEPRDVARACATHPACAPFLVRSMLRLFGSAEPDEATVRSWATRFEEREGNVEAFLRDFLVADDFFAWAGERSLVKSPVEYAVGAVRQLGVNVSFKELAEQVEAMGQSLFHPPSVAGFSKHRRWLSATTMLARSSFAWRLGELAARTAPHDEASLDDMVTTLGLEPLPERARTTLEDHLARGRRAACWAALLSHPSYQLA